MKRWIKVLLSVLVAAVILITTVIAALGAYVNAIVDYNLDEKLFSSAHKSNTVTYMAYDGAGELTEVCKEASGPALSWVSIDEVSPWLKLGYISAEDRDFYKHRGINVRRTVAAAANSVLHYTSGFGASTITQQVIKNISGDNERTIARKISEVFRAIHLEMSHTKDEIFEVYMNVIPMSGNIFGVREASLSYFGKEPSELSLAEAATMVGITNAPGRYDPFLHPDECREKRDSVLFAMRDCGVITEDEYCAAANAPLVLVSDGYRRANVISWFVESARTEILADLCDRYSLSRVGASLLLSSGTKVVLTVDPAVQAVLEEYFEDLSHFPKEVGAGLEYAMVVCDSGSGDIVGMIGAVGDKCANRLFNYATAPHPPASTLKPLALYAPLLEKGAVSWSTLFDDAPTEVKEEDGEIYMYPKNSPDIYEGRISLYKALISSKNTVAAQMYGMLTPSEIFNSLKETFEFNTLVESKMCADGRELTDLALAPLAMGQLTEGISLVDLTHAYTVFPCDGALRGGRTYYGVIGSDGTVLLDNPSKEKRVFKEQTARVMNMMLSGVAEEGTARSIRLKEKIDTAAKTGTSSWNKDKLLVGYTPYYTAGIWCGFKDGCSGVGSLNPNHIRIWDEVMDRIHERVSRDAESEDLLHFCTHGLQGAFYCKESGCIATDACKDCATVEYGYFASMPENECTIHGRE